jgi:peptide/nickel transport system substrate-binding protein
MGKVAIGAAVVVVGGVSYYGLTRGPSASTSSSSTTSTSSSSSAASSSSQVSQTPSPPSEPPKYGGTLRVAFGDPLRFGPPTQFENQFVVGQLYNHLTRYEKGWQYVVAPDLAQSWVISPDHLTYTFTLAKNVNWHDGQPFTSADVAYSFDQNGPNRNGSIAFSSAVDALLDHVETPDDYTVIFHMKKPTAEFDFFVTWSTVWVYPQHVWQGTDWSGTGWQGNPANQKPIGTGPFMFKEYVQGDHYTFVRNPSYFKQGMPYLDSVIGKVIPDPEARILALENNEVDYAINDVPYADIATIKSNPALGYALAGNQATGWYLVVNHRRPIMANQQVRQAIYYAIDKQSIVDKVTFGADRVPQGTFNSDAKYYKPNTLAPRYTYNPTMAKQLLDQAGYPVGSDGTRFTIKLVSWNQTDILQMGQLIQQWLKDVNINVNLVPVDKNTMISTTFTTPWDYDLSNLGTFPDGGPTPDTATRGFSDSTFDFSSTGGVPFTNGGAYHNSALDTLWAQASAEIDDTKRTQLYWQVQDILADQLPYMLLREGNFKHAYNKDFVGVPYGYISWSMFENAEGVYWEKGSLTSTSTTA